MCSCRLLPQSLRLKEPLGCFDVSDCDLDRGLHVPNQTDALIDFSVGLISNIQPEPIAPGPPDALGSDLLGE